MPWKLHCQTTITNHHRWSMLLIYVIIDSEHDYHYQQLRDHVVNHYIFTIMDHVIVYLKTPFWTITNHYSPFTSIVGKPFGEPSPTITHHWTSMNSTTITGYSPLTTMTPPLLTNNNHFPAISLAREPPTVESARARTPWSWANGVRSCEALEMVMVFRGGSKLR